MTNQISEIKIDNLSDLENEIEKLKNAKVVEKEPEILFRGHQNADWGLHTTLERYIDKNIDIYRDIGIKEYNKFLHIAYNKITAITSKKYNCSPYTDQEYTIELPYSDENQEYMNTFYNRYNKESLCYFIPPNIELMVYVRHHGFPSPLLDWTSSLYIALYFAFQNKITCDNVAIFVLIVTGSNTSFTGRPTINIINNNILGHKRHLLQQASYSCAVVKKDASDNSPIYYSLHENAMKNTYDEDYKIYKFILPVTLRENILNKLNEYNINAYSLFQTEDTLCEYIATKKEFKEFF